MTQPPVASTPPEDPAQPHLDPRLLELLVCPVTKTTLAYDAARQELVSRAARLAFPIIDGMPVLVVGEARQLEDGDPALRRG